MNHMPALTCFLVIHNFISHFLHHKLKRLIKAGTTVLSATGEVGNVLNYNAGDTGYIPRYVFIFKSLRV
jgi:hypothetical protein